MKSILVLPAIFSVGVTQTHAAEATRPNILFISVDDLGHSTLCCRGRRYSPTERFFASASRMSSCR